MQGNKNEEVKILAVNAGVASGRWVPKGQGTTPAITHQGRRIPATQPQAPLCPAPHCSTHHNEARNLVEVIWKPQEGGRTLDQESGGREGNQEKHYATRTEHHANKASSRTQTQCRHLPWNVLAQKRQTAGQEYGPPCSQTMVNAININIVTGQRYRQPTSHQRMPKNYTRDHSS